MARYKRTVLVVALLLAALPAAVALAKKAPVDVHGTTWFLRMKVQLKVQKVGGYKDMDEWYLYMGPNAGQSLASDEFKLRSVSTGDTYIGTWSDPKGKGSIILNIDPGDVEDELRGDVVNILQTKYTTVLGVTLHVNKLKVKCKIKPGKGASISLKADMVGAGSLDGEYMEGKVKFAAKGKGEEIL